MFALVDCNNFYCSCERVFEPSLVNRPIIVLTNNDGCVVARSNEVKALGIPMGEPFFKVKELVKKHGIVVRSSNYELYADLSSRVFQTLEEFCPHVECYSIDEGFIDMDIPHPVPFALELRKTVLRNTGIPVSIGVSATKTLAKVASKIAKKSPHGVCSPLTFAEQTQALTNFPVGDLWGVGRQYAKMLARYGIDTALKLRDADIDWVRDKMTVMGVKMVLELRGESCIPLETVLAENRQIIRSRSFGRPVTELAELEGAVSMHISRAAEKLREDSMVPNLLIVYIRTNPFNKSERQYGNSAAMRLTRASNDTSTLVRYALRGLGEIYRPNHRYKKCGVICMELVPQSQAQLSLFDDEADLPKQTRLNDAMDKINRRYGSLTLHHATIPPTRLWAMKREMISRAYTTSWDELPIAKTG
jgi:DNA polymerase V